MSESSGGTSAVSPHPPARQVIATFDTYADAESAVDYLSDQHFTVDKLAIVGRDIELVEQIVGRLNYGWAALRGAAAGALTGALFGWIFGLLDWVQPRCSRASRSPSTGWYSAPLSALCSACSCMRCRAAGATSPQSSHYNHVTTKSSPMSRSRTKPSACSPAGPIERNESWRLLWV